MKYLILLDYSWLYHRYNHVFGNLSVTHNSIELKTGTIFGFCNLVESIITNYKKQNIELKIIFCQDSKSTFRKEIYSKYKSNRDTEAKNKDKLFNNDSYIFQILSLLKNIAFASAEGFEADDILASLSFSLKDKFDKVIIHSGDKDMYQLYHKGISISNKIEKGIFLEITEQDILNSFDGCPVDCLLNYRALLGDKSDNIDPVVPRLPKKFALKLAQDFTHSITNNYTDKTEKKYWDLFKINKDIYAINYRIMDLLKYENLPIKVNLTRSFTDNRHLVNKLNLSKFESFLKYIDVLT